MSSKKESLNPYSIGRYSMSGYTPLNSDGTPSLNPYSIGRYSMSRLSKMAKNNKDAS